ncbi:MAG TPA: hypothetical protein VJ044_05660, partial [Candidatus Hodarchaeales archaeon]|nr:hypothetical protein [Candidatus Hodarchaeales archaeon]
FLIIVIALLGSELVSLVTSLTNVGYLTGFALVNLSVIQSREKRKGIERPFKVPFYPYTPILAASACFLLILLSLLSHPLTLMISFTFVMFLLLSYYLRILGRERIQWAVAGSASLSGLILMLLLFFLPDDLAFFPVFLSFVENSTYLVIAIGSLATSLLLSVHRGRLSSYGRYLSLILIVCNLTSLSLIFAAYPGNVEELVIGGQVVVNELVRTLSLSLISVSIISSTIGALFFFGPQQKKRMESITPSLP